MPRPITPDLSSAPSSNPSFIVETPPMSMYSDDPTSQEDTCATTILYDITEADLAGLFNSWRSLSPEHGARFDLMLDLDVRSYATLGVTLHERLQRSGCSFLTLSAQVIEDNIVQLVLSLSCSASDDGEPCMRIEQEIAFDPVETPLATRRSSGAFGARLPPETRARVYAAFAELIARIDASRIKKLDLTGLQIDPYTEGEDEVGYFLELRGAFDAVERVRCSPSALVMCRFSDMAARERHRTDDDDANLKISLPLFPKLGALAVVMPLGAGTACEEERMLSALHSYLIAYSRDGHGVGRLELECVGRRAWERARGAADRLAQILREVEWFQDGWNGAEE